MAKIKEIAENAYLFIKAKWLPMLLTAAFLAFSLQSLQINNFGDEQSRDRSNAVQTIIDDNRTIQFCFINAWDEYHERQGPIEPHVDANVNGVTPGSIADDYLYTTTSGYIDQLRS